VIGGEIVQWPQLARIPGRFSRLFTLRGWGTCRGAVDASVLRQELRSFALSFVPNVRGECDDIAALLRSVAVKALLVRDYERTIAAVFAGGAFATILIASKPHLNAEDLNRLGKRDTFLDLLEVDVLGHVNLLSMSLA
jgi:hypothetical protein